MKIIIHRGTHQIGGCAAEIRTEQHRIIIDCGANLPGSEMDDAITDEQLLEKLFHRGEPCDGVLFSHYHGDHMGLYREIPQEYPLYAGATAKKMLECLTKRLDSIPGTIKKGLPRIQGIQPYFPNKQLIFGDIKVTPYVTDHSALDAYMFLIEADGKKVLFTGDFREHGIAGAKNTLEKLVNTYIKEVDVLITEGTMLSRMEEVKHNLIQTEEDLGRRAGELFQANKESVILVSSTNLDSIMEFYHGLPWGMDFVCDAYQAELILTAMADKGKYYARYRPKLIHGKPRRFCIVGEMEGLGAEHNCCKADFSVLKKRGFTMLARESNPMFQRITAKFHDPLIIYSKWTGYLEGKHADPKIRNFIGNYRMEVLHTGGHAYAETIEKLIRLTNPEVIVPMHTECPENFGRTEAFEVYGDRVKVLQDGEEYLC